MAEEPNTIPVFPRNAALACGQVSTANTNRDGTGTVATILTAGASGTRITYIEAKAQVTTTAGMVRLFLHDGSTFFLWKELTVDAVTVSGTVASWTEAVDLTADGKQLDLPSGWTLRASTHNAEAIDITVFGRNF